MDFEHTLGSDWLSHGYPELTERGKVAEGPTPYLSGVRFVLADGGVLWVRLHAAAIDDDRRDDCLSQRERIPDGAPGP